MKSRVVQLLGGNGCWARMVEVRTVVKELCSWGLYASFRCRYSGMDSRDCTPLGWLEVSAALKHRALLEFKDGTWSERSESMAYWALA